MFLVKCALVLCAAVAASGYSLSFTDVEFHLYTREQPTLSQPILPTVDSIVSSGFRISQRTILTIHNNGEGVTSNFNAFMVRDHLAAEDVNVIAVDWSRGSFLYSVGLANAPQAGERIAEIINVLVNNFGYNPNMVRIVGVGLGGHIAGITARHINGEIPHIVALDPSFHGWTHHPYRLNADDAGVVEVLHTTAGALGYDYPLGDLDFYPNGGTFQSGCADVNCSYMYSYIYYAESLTSEVVDGAKFVGTACESYEQAIAITCDGERDVVFGGSEVKSGVSGIYSFRTNFVQPFALG